ncbi:MAG TPA: hypothetical protein VJ837_04150, partial [Candidatus Paceibacterota bacterium]|nr:hypothetical protein [Candidatus Paceibacterota bacterium]
PLPNEQVFDDIQLELREVAKDYYGKSNIAEFTQGFMEKFVRERYALAAAAPVLVREIKRAEAAESPRDKILLAYDVLRRTTRMTRSSAEGGRTDLKTVLRNAAMEAGASAYLVDRTLQSILGIRDEVYRSDGEVELCQAQEFIDSTKSLFRMMGVFKD